MTIYVVGVETDTTLRRFIEYAHAAGRHIELINLRAVVRHPWRIEVGCADEVARLRSTPGINHRLPSDGNYYVRVVDLSSVAEPELAPAWRHLVAALATFFDSVRGTVVNRPGAHVHNGTKPLHEWWLAQRGLSVPASITTSERSRILEFIDVHGSAIVKTITGVRGIAQLVDAARFYGFTRARGPVHVQQWIDGFDVRAHLVGQEVFAERIDSGAVDYRARGADRVHTRMDVPDETLANMSAAAKLMGLEFTGWDFRVDADGRWWCLEANPMPGYDWYDRRCDGAISDALCRLLEP